MADLPAPAQNGQRRRFVSTTSPVPVGPPIEFEVEGRHKDGSTFVESFTASMDVPPGVLLGLASSNQYDSEQARLIVGLAAVDAFMKACLDSDEDRDRWRRLLNDPNRHVDFQVLLDVATWLAEQIGARPTGLPSA